MRAGGGLRICLIAFCSWTSRRFDAFFRTVIQITFGNDAAAYGLAEFSLCRVFSNGRRDCSARMARLGKEICKGNLQVTNSDNRLRLVSDSEAHVRSIIATLEENRAALIESCNLEAAHI